MPVPTETLYNTKKVSVVFAISSIALLASLVWLIKVDYARPWRQIQDEYVDLQASLAYFDYLEMQSEERQHELARARGTVRTAREQRDDRQEEVRALLAAVRNDLDDRPVEVLGKVLEQFRGPYHHAYASRARSVDRSFSEVMAGYVEEGDAEALVEDFRAEPAYRDHLETLLRWFDLRDLEARASTVRGTYQHKDLIQKNLSSELTVAEVMYEHERALHGEDARKTREAHRELTRLQEAFTVARREFEEVADLQDEIEEQIALLNAELDEAERQLALIEKDHADAEKRYRDYAGKVRHGLFNLPLMDFAAPKGVPGRHEIRQVVLHDVRVDLNFVESHQTDRCTTCHVAIDNRDFSKENLSVRLESAISSINEKLRNEGKPPLRPPVVPGREDLEPGQVAGAWDSLTADEQDAFFDAVVHEINRFQRMEDRPLLKFGQPLLAHPDLDLYVSADSPHPITQMGCTVCHEGSGEETDFVLAAHTPPTREIREEWKRKYYVRTAGLMPEQDFETAEHHWNRPMHIPKFTEAGCTKCHTQATDVVRYDGRPAAQRINKGRFLFQSLGCINCHHVEDLDGARRVGPDLVHVKEKMTRGFMQNWIYFPRDYRPSTTMPHYFLQENNDAASETAGGDTDPVLRTRAEVVAMTEFLMAMSTDYERSTPPEDLWEELRDEEGEAYEEAVDRGRRLFGSVGCLGCHATLAYAPDDPFDLVEGPPVGETWISNDISFKLEDLALDAQRAMLRKLKERAIRAAIEDGEDPEAVSLADEEGVEDRIAILTDEGDRGIPLDDLIEIFEAAWDGSRYDADSARREVYRRIIRARPERLRAVALDDDEQDLVHLTDEAFDAILGYALDHFEEMSYVRRVEYAMENFSSAEDTLFDPENLTRPVFTRFAPELSSIRTKFDSYEHAVTWLYDWLKNPRHYSSSSKMPRLRLERGEFPVVDPETGEETGERVDADEALDIAVYLSTLAENEAFPTEPFDADEQERARLAGIRDEMLMQLLGALNSEARSRAIINDETGELSDLIIAKMTEQVGEHEARLRVASMDLEQRRWVYFGDRMVGHYGCYACHLVGGYERAAPPGTELTTWGEKELSQLDFAFFEPAFEAKREKDPLFRDVYPHDRAKLIEAAGTNPPARVDHTLASFAWYKMRNPRIWDRKKIRPPYEKLRMPNFFVTDEETDALVTYLLSRKPGRIGPSLQVPYGRSPTGKVARGRDLAWELNCVGCHRIDGNAAVIDQYIERFEVGFLVFDEVNAPPGLRGQGAKTQHNWLYKFLNDVDMLRPWLTVRMPSFDLTDEEATTLVEYFVGLSQQESQWLASHLRPVEKYISDAYASPEHARPVAALAESEADEEDAAPVSGDGLPPGADWFADPSLAREASLLRRYAIDNRLVPAGAVDPLSTDFEGLAAAYAGIVDNAQFLRDLMDVRYPFTERPPAVDQIPDYHDYLVDGEAIFTVLECLRCHVFGDPGFPGANTAPTAPNLRLAHERLRREWVRRWLEMPSRIQPGTQMPALFGTGHDSAFQDFPEEDRAILAEVFRTGGMLDEAELQVRAMTDWIFDAGAKNQNVILPDTGGLDALTGGPGASEADGQEAESVQPEIEELDIEEVEDDAEELEAIEESS